MNSAYPQRDVDDPRWRTFITRNNVPCPACSYNLRGLESDRCPECGSFIDPQAIMFVGRDEPILRGIGERLGVWGAVFAAGFLHLVGHWIAPGIYALDGHEADLRMSVPRMFDVAVSLPLLLAALVMAWPTARPYLRRSADSQDWLELMAAHFDHRAWRICWVLVSLKAIGLLIVFGLNVA